MKEKIQQLFDKISGFRAETLDQLETVRIEYLSRKGLLQELFNDFKNVSPDDRKEIGMLLNTLKQKVQEMITEQKEQLELTSQPVNEAFDLTLPVEFAEIGSRHPVSIVQEEICNIFSRLGFTIRERPEIEDDFHNFSALNFPPDHPARDMQDTFFVEKNPDIALRTHTSSVQVRVMETEKPPIRIIAPGRVFRNEAISARSHCFFHQIEGLYIDKNVSFADMKHTLQFFVKEFFGPESVIRLRPSYFPFTEPSGEMDVSCSICGGKGCNVCKYTGFLEIMGCGMVDPAVLDACGIDSNVYSGFAFGMGIDRITMLKFGIKDIRLLFENDMRFLRQFKSAW